MSKNLRAIVKAGVILAGCLAVTSWAAPVMADPNGGTNNGKGFSAGFEGEQTPADILHPQIHDNNGPKENANPNGVSPSGGGGMHGIANAQGGNGGVANLGNVHGGIDRVNQNVP
jgi:hypothetical protein